MSTDRLLALIHFIKEGNMTEEDGLGALCGYVIEHTYKHRYTVDNTVEEIREFWRNKTGKPQSIADVVDGMRGTGGGYEPVEIQP